MIPHYNNLQINKFQSSGRIKHEGRSIQQGCTLTHLSLRNICKSSWKVLSLQQIVLLSQKYDYCYRYLHDAGYYGTSQSETFKENSQAGSDYLAEVCKGWEQEAEKASVKRVIILRTGEPPEVLEYMDEE